MGYGKLPICIAKTQYSFSDDPKNLECKDDYNINVRGVELKNGAGFVVVLAGKIMTMPGLPKKPAAPVTNTFLLIFYLLLIYNYLDNSPKIDIFYILYLIFILNSEISLFLLVLLKMAI